MIGRSDAKRGHPPKFMAVAQCWLPTIGEAISPLPLKSAIDLPLPSQSFGCELLST
jgi:hypothetical protein